MKHSYLSILKVSIGKVYIRMLKSYGAYFFQFPHSSKSMMLFDRKTKQSPKNNRTHKSCIDPDFSHSYLAPLLQIYKIIRSEEHTSELQSRFDIVCRLLLEKKTI